jgi:hypothetical protein
LGSINNHLEVTVHRRQDAIHEIGIRIERAYRRIYPEWNSQDSPSGVWELAASRLLEAPNRWAGAPIDPELFVAAQTRPRLSPDPFMELTRTRALGRYLKSIRQIIRQLRGELKSEIRRAEICMSDGTDLVQALSSLGLRISPIARLILAYRAGRSDVAMTHRLAALSQDRSCPLYRLAVRSLLPDHLYPLSEVSSDFSHSGSELISFSLN